MGISKVNFGRNTLIDLTNDSVTASTLAKGATAHNAAGEQVIGTFEPALIVTVTKNADGTFGADKTNQEIYEAFQKGIYIEARRLDLELVYKLYDVPNDSKVSFVSTMMDSASGSAIGYDTININSNVVTYKSVNSVDGIAEATGSAKGLMSSLDKTKLDSIDYGATKIVVDSILSSGSKNPVENYIIKAALDNLENSKLSKSGGTLTGNVSGKYFCGTWLQSTEASNLGHVPNRIAVLDDSGWIYYRTVAEILNDIGGASKSYVDSAITQAINSAY